jgi:membrane dipeptidase
MTESNARRLHDQAIILDAHSDILIPIADGICNLAERANVPSPDAWQGLPGFSAANRPTPYRLSDYATWFGCAGQYSNPQFREGGLTALITAVYISDQYLNRPVERAMSLISALHREIAASPNALCLATSTTDILQAKREGKTALVLSFEGAEALGHNLELLNAYYALGLRMVGLTHSRRNIWADGTQMNVRTGGLSSLGRELVKRLNEMRILIDLAHLSDTCFWEVLELSVAPLVVTHTSFRREYPGYRAPWLQVHPEKTTSKLQALATHGGVLGVVFWGQENISSIVDDIAFGLDAVGDRHVGLGSDFYSLDGAPVDLQDISQLPRLTDALLARGYSDETILNLLGNNWMRVFREVIDKPNSFTG